MVKVFYDENYKIIGHSTTTIEGASGSIEITEQEWLDLLSITDEKYLNTQTPENLSLLVYKTPIKATPQWAIDLENEAKEAQARAAATELIVQKQIEKIAGELSAAEVETIKILIPEWTESAEYNKDSLVNYNGKVYKVTLKHKAQIDWTPAAAASLFAPLLTSTDGTILDWVQPISTNPYMKGDKVKFNDEVYESLINNNVWSPAAYAQGWKLV